MTRCSHVKTLNPPFSPEFLTERHEANRLWRLSSRGDKNTPQHGWHHDIRPYGRFMAEYWVTNDRGPRPDHVNYYLKYLDNHNHKYKRKDCLVEEEQICTDLN